MKEPGPTWYYRMDKMRVENDLEGTKIEKELGIEKEIFVKFAAKKRINYKDNLELEYKEFKNRRKRLIEIDVKRYDKIRNKIFARDDYTCQYCGKRGGTLEIDHIIPFSKGGSEKEENLVTTCFDCNRKKRDYFLEELGMSLINDPREGD